MENDRWCDETSHPDYDGMACTVGMPEERGSITLIKKSSGEETAAESDESVTNEEMDISIEADDEGSSNGEIAISNEENEEWQKVPPDKETSPPTVGVGSRGETPVDEGEMDIESSMESSCSDSLSCCSDERTGSLTDVQGSDSEESDEYVTDEERAH